MILVGNSSKANRSLTIREFEARVISMYETPIISLVVLRVSNIERAAEFYAAIGLTFQREQHGTGPEHFSTWVGNTVFELYPASEHFPLTPSRIGFTVTAIETVLAKWQQHCKVLSEPKVSPYGIRAVVADPDGHRIELTQIEQIELTQTVLPTEAAP